jgi:hypothetical protein
MITTALLEVEGLPCRLIEELTYCEREQRARGRFAGEVLKATKDDKFSSFIGNPSITQSATVVPLLKLPSCTSASTVPSCCQNAEIAFK